MTTARKLMVIGESLNYSVPRIKELMDEEDVEGIVRIARQQQDDGASYISVNVGGRPPEFMGDLVKAIQGGVGDTQGVTLPLDINSDHLTTLQAGVKVYDSTVGSPILDSATETRAEAVISLAKESGSGVVFLVDERGLESPLAQNRTVDETYETAQRLIKQALDNGIPRERIWVDPGICPILADSFGNIKRVLGFLERFHADPENEGINTVVGLGNLPRDLPKGKETGTTRNFSRDLTRAFLTRAMEYGLSAVISSTRRNHTSLEPDDPHLALLDRFLGSEDEYGAPVLVVRDPLFVEAKRIDDEAKDRKLMLGALEADKTASEQSPGTRKGKRKQGN